MTKTPQCAFCRIKEGVLVLRNGAKICPACRKGLRKYLGPELGKPICKRRAGPARKGRVRDAARLAWIRTLPCVVCDAIGICVECNRAVKVSAVLELKYCPSCYDDLPMLTLKHQVSPTEAAHTGPHGVSQKADDDTAIPLCGIEHHREGAESYHKLGRKFFAHHGLDRDVLIQELNARFQAEKERAA